MLIKVKIISEQIFLFVLSLTRQCKNPKYLVSQRFLLKFDLTNLLAINTNNSYPPLMKYVCAGKPLVAMNIIWCAKCVKLTKASKTSAVSCFYLELLPTRCYQTGLGSESAKFLMCRFKKCQDDWKPVANNDIFELTWFYHLERVIFQNVLHRQGWF